MLKFSNVIANSVDPDQTPHSAASDLGLHCLPMSLLWDARHKWVNKCLKYIHLFKFSDLKPFNPLFLK